MDVCKPVKQLALFLSQTQQVISWVINNLVSFIFSDYSIALATLSVPGIALQCTELVGTDSSPMTKGAVPLEEELKNSSSGKTYAAIVGVSNYMDPGIPDLRYAHRDANIFADFLQDPRGADWVRTSLKSLSIPMPLLQAFSPF